VRRLRSVLLATLLCAATVAGVAPAASAATPFGIAWRFFGGPGVTPSTSAQICPTGADYQPGQTVQVQVLTNGAWITRRTFPVPSLLWACIDVSPAQVIARPGRYAWRAVTQQSGGPLVTAQATVNALADRNDVYLTDYPAYSYTVQAKRITARVGLARGQIVELQRLDRATWTPLARVRAPQSGSDVPVTFGVPARAGNAAYRVVSHATTWTQQGAARPVTLHQTDYARYASYIAAIRRTVVSICPQNPIYVDSQLVLRGNSANPNNAIGRAHLSGSSSGADNVITASIHFRSGMSGTQLKHVAFHECGHVVQWRSRVVDNYDAEEDRAYAFFPYNGFEGQADCMAYLFVRDRRSLYYVPNCSSAQLTEAGRMWNTYGYRFQPSPYAWRSAAASAAASGGLTTTSVPGASAP
jgi:hypothetical protein